MAPGLSPFPSGNMRLFLSNGWWKLQKAGITFSTVHFCLSKVRLSGLRAEVKRTNPNILLRKIPPFLFWFNECSLCMMVFCKYIFSDSSFSVMLLNRTVGSHCGTNWNQAKRIAAMRQLASASSSRSTGYTSKHDRYLKYLSYLLKCFSCKGYETKAVSLDCCVQACLRA